MVAKKRNFEMKTVLMILIVLLIALAAAYVILNPSEETEDVILIENLRLNKENYEGKTVTVSGIYRLKDGRDALTTPTTDSDPNSEEYIYLDFETNNINLTETPAVAGDKYKVKGEVEIVTEGFANQVQIIVESFIKV